MGYNGRRKQKIHLSSNLGPYFQDRTIPPPSHHGLGLGHEEGIFQCAADGNPSKDPLLEDLQDPLRPLTSDSSLRARIYERYLHFGGRRYEHDLPAILPTSESDRPVFTHGDIALRNIMVDEECCITGIIDWEYAGRYPDYWEYAQIMRPAFWGDWSVWMERTAPKRWDISGIKCGPEGSVLDLPLVILIENMLRI